MMDENSDNLGKIDKDPGPPVRIPICATDLKATVNGVEYTWVGYYGALLESNEWLVKQGEVRIIGSIIFFAFGVEGPIWRRRKVSWCPQIEIDGEWIRNFRESLFLGRNWPR